MIRTYRDKDFEKVRHLLAESLVFDTITPEILKEKLYADPDFSYDTCFVTEENGTLQGFMQGVIRTIKGVKTGYLKLMAVDSASRKNGIARKMYQKLEDHFRDSGVSKVRIFDTPLNYFSPGIDPRYTEALCFAWRMGFERFDDTSNLVVDLESRDWSTERKEHDLAVEGIVISRATEEDRVELLHFLEEHFDLWRHEVAVSYQSDPVAVHIARFNNHIRGFSAYNGNNIGSGSFGPMGTSKEMRGKGIGEVLMKRCLADMRQQGMKTAVIPWVGPIPFYSRHTGARVDRVFWRFEKNL